MFDMIESGAVIWLAFPDKYYTCIKISDHWNFKLFSWKPSNTDFQNTYILFFTYVKKIKYNFSTLLTAILHAFSACLTILLCIVFYLDERRNHTSHPPGRGWAEVGRVRQGGNGQMSKDVHSPTLLLCEEVIVVLGAGWHNLKMVLMFETFLSFCPARFFVENWHTKNQGHKKKGLIFFSFLFFFDLSSKREYPYGNEGIDFSWFPSQSAKESSMS